jgi:hypothetical protein
MNVPCRKVLGQGQYCCEEYLCESCIEIRRLQADNAALAEQAEKWQGAYEEIADMTEGLRKDAARWRWALDENQLWMGIYDWGCPTHEDRNAAADACIAAMAAGEKAT